MNPMFRKAHTFSLLHPRDQIVATMDRIYTQDMTTTSGGNISLRDDSGHIWITPARVDKGRLCRNDIVRLNPDGTYEGTHPPSSEYPFHLGIYAKRPDIRAVIHAHPGALVSYSICGRVPDTRLFPEAWNLCAKVAFAKYARPGSHELGVLIAEQFGSEKRPDCVILENHGVVVGGADLTAAFQRFETLEFTAQTLIAAMQLGDVQYLTDEQLDMARGMAAPLPEDPAWPLCGLAVKERRIVAEFVHRACAHRLMSSTWGSLSARVGPDTFVITPSHVDREELGESDVVIVREGRRPRGQFPSRAARLHRAIYAAHPDVHAIVNALPVHGTAFSASRLKLDTRTIPESYLFLKDVPKVRFEDVYETCERVADQIGPDHPVALLENNGVLVAGRSVLDAFDRLEVLEATAAALIRSLALGPVTPMPEVVINDLLEAFPAV